MSTTAATSAKLYSLQLKLRPLERGTLMPFSGELVHGAWLKWVREAAPDVATMLHEGNQRRLFTCSSLQFPIPQGRMRQAEQENIHLPLEPEKTYTLRITLLLGELYQLFYSTLMRISTSGVKWQPFVVIGKRTFLLEEVISSPDDPSGWTGFTSFAALVEQAKARAMGRALALELEFVSLTTFNRLYLANKIYGNHYARLPLPHYLFPGLAKRWQEIAPPEFAHIVQKERIEAYIEAEGMVIEDYNLQPHYVRFAEHPQKGFVGACTYLLRGPDEPTDANAPLTVRQQIVLLSQLAFYTGVGYKPAMGMGQVRLKSLA
ncbi:MAG: CRISPR system precrRNA processing endoribonuclease RAMP protein Cas6 [Chloroflexota bacterium]|nr:CRISPR system precrRNA processing endoribonuclease RAMP protein Cas6 [Chloroflexota bacterium]